jgi:hypothetical protein
MLRPQAVERREIGNPVSPLQRTQPFLGAIRILGDATCMALYHKKKNQRQGKCRRTESLISIYLYFPLTLLLESGVLGSNVVQEASRLSQAIEKEGLQGGKGVNNEDGRPQHMHDPGIQQEPRTIGVRCTEHGPDILKTQPVTMQDGGIDRHPHGW